MKTTIWRILFIITFVGWFVFITDMLLLRFAPAIYFVWLIPMSEILFIKVMTDKLMTLPYKGGE